MIEQTANPKAPRPRAATASVVVGAVAWLSPLIALIAGIGGSALAGDGGTILIALACFTVGLIATGVLGIIGSLICLFGCGSSPYPEQERPWLLPKVLNYPLGLLGFVGGVYWLAQIFR